MYLYDDTTIYKLQKMRNHNYWVLYRVYLKHDQSLGLQYYGTMGAYEATKERQSKTKIDRRTVKKILQSKETANV